MKQCKIDFEIRGKVGKEERLFIGGSNKQLGNWDPIKAMPTKQDAKGKGWVSMTCIYVSTRDVFEFKCFFKNSTGNFLRWENFSGNRIVKSQWHKAEVCFTLDKPQIDIQPLQKYIQTSLPNVEIKARVMSATPLSKGISMNDLTGKSKYSYDDMDKPNSISVFSPETANMESPKIIKTSAMTPRNFQNFLLKATCLENGSQKGEEVVNTDEEINIDTSSDSERGRRLSNNYLHEGGNGLIEVVEPTKSSEIQLIEEMTNNTITKFINDCNFFFVTAMLPITVTKEDDGTYSVSDYLVSSSQIFYYIRKYMHKKHRFPWIGCLVFEGKYEEKNKLKRFIFENHAFWPVFISKHEYESAYNKVYREYLRKIFSVSSLKLFEEITEPGFYDIEHDWNVFENVSKYMAQSICELKKHMDQNKQTYVVINELMCIMIPQYFLQLKTRVNCCFYFHTVFPHLNHLRKTPKFRRIFMSLFACDLIMFTSNLQAFNFIKACKDAFLLDIEYEKAASIKMNYKGRHIFIGIMAIGIEKSIVSATKNTMPKERLMSQFKDELKDRVFVFTNEHEDIDACLIKLDIVEHLLKSRGSVLPEVYFLFCITSVLTDAQIDKLKDYELRINERAGFEVIHLIIKTDLKKYKRIAYYQLADIYFEASFQERPSWYSLEYKILRKETGKLMTDDLSSSVDALNYNVIKENPMRMEKFCTKFKDLIIEVSKTKKEKSKKMTKRIESSENILPLLDPETSPLYSLDAWFEYLIGDLKNSYISQTTHNFQFTQNNAHDYELIASHIDYLPIGINQIYRDLMSVAGMLVIDFDSLFMNNETVLSLLHFRNQRGGSMKIYSSIKNVIEKQFGKFIEYLKLFEKNPKLKVILFSIREKKLFNLLFEGIEIENVIIMIEAGCYYKKLTKGHDNFTLVLANVSDDWIHAVKPSIENYTERYNLFSIRYHSNFIELSFAQRYSEITKGIYLV